MADLPVMPLQLSRQMRMLRKLWKKIGNISDPDLLFYPGRISYLYFDLSQYCDIWIAGKYFRKVFWHCFPWLFLVVYLKNVINNREVSVFYRSALGRKLHSCSSFFPVRQTPNVLKNRLLSTYRDVKRDDVILNTIFDNIDSKMFHNLLIVCWFFKRVFFLL